MALHPSNNIQHLVATFKKFSVSFSFNRKGVFGADSISHHAQPTSPPPSNFLQGVVMGDLDSTIFQKEMLLKVGGAWSIIQKVIRSHIFDTRYKHPVVTFPNLHVTALGSQQILNLQP